MIAAPDRETPPPPTQDDELRAFLLVLRQALLTIVAYIERKYGLERRR